MSEQNRPVGSGLKWRNRKHGPPIPYWFADQAAVKAGYPLKSMNLLHLANNSQALLERAQRLQSEMRLWMNGARDNPPFDGAFGSLLDIYQHDSESTFRALKPHVRDVYAIYINRLRTHIGELQVDRCDGRDVRRWFALWRAGTGDRDHLPRAHMVLSVLKAAVSFGIVCRHPGCSEFRAILGEMEFPSIKSRTQAPTAGQVEAVRRAAHAAGHPERALVYALQFETALRQWDVVGQWVPIADPQPSALIHKDKKWIGPTWGMIGPDMVLKIRPSKTSETSAVDVVFDLSVCPMVMDELASVPENARTGPLIVNPATGLPYYGRSTFLEGWKADFKAAGMPPELWNRDLRAGGVTEGGRAGAAKDDTRKVAGHSNERTTEIYDRDMVEAHRRVMAKRKAFRDQNGS